MLVAGQECICYGLGDFICNSKKMYETSKNSLSTKEHLNRALKSKRMGAISYVVANTVWQSLTLGVISAFQQSLSGRVERSIPKEILLPISIFFPTLFATIIMTPFNAVKIVSQTASKNKVLGIFEAVRRLNFGLIYRGTCPIIVLSTAKITTGLSLAIILGNNLKN